jgi:hypothetical protein
MGNNNECKKIIYEEQLINQQNNQNEPKQLKNQTKRIESKQNYYCLILPWQKLQI